MARYTESRSKIARRFGQPIFGACKQLKNKNYAPGQHGKKRKKTSDYAVQLMEKQKAKYIYGVLERQFRNTFDKATRKAGVTGTVLLQLLEARLDNTVYRLGISSTRRGARQLVSHKHIVVNGQVVNIPSYSLQPGDVITVRDYVKEFVVVTESLKLGSATKYNWLQWNTAEMKGTFLNYPEREAIPETIKEQLIVELYSK